VPKNVQICNLDDATYEKLRAHVALAEHLGVPLLTCDARLGRAHGHGHGHGDGAEVLVYPRS
jgi:hypothetical protein